MCHPVQTPICLLFHPSGRRVIPSGHQTDKHHLSGWRVSSVRTPTSSGRRFSSTSERLSVLEWFTNSFQVQEREDQSTVRTMWYPVRMHISVRQESQFKMNRPDICQLWSERWCIVYGNCRFNFNRLDVSPSWSGLTRIKYGNCVMKFTLPDAPAPWSGRAKPVMGNYLQWTCVRPDDRAIPSGRCSYIGKISPRKFRKILSHSCPSGRPWFTVRTAPK